MDTVEFSSLYEKDYNLSHLLAIRQSWRENQVFRMESPRRTSCLLYFSGGSAQYEEGGRCFTVPRGSIVYIPEGAVYDTRFFDCAVAAHQTVLVEFRLLTPGGDPFRAAEEVLTVRPDSTPLLDSLFEEAVELFSAAVVPVPALKAVVYRLLAELSRTRRRQALHERRFAAIRPGVTYMESQPCGDLSLEEIAALCHLSPGTFRRLFREYAGVSPMEYRTAARLTYAKKLLQSGVMTTAEVAVAAGFEDAAYFCRVFKKHVGKTPGEYAGRMKN